MNYDRIRSLIIRHRIAIRDLSLIFVGVLLALYYAYEVDIFANEGPIAVHEAVIELDEALLIGALVTFALFVFGVRQYLGQQREMAARIAAERHVRELAYQDGLTGLPNRRQYEEALKAAVDAPPRAGASHGVFLLDLNGFKQINDVHGHGVGDEVLVIIAQRLRSEMRNGDIVARFGGDEFAVLATHLADPEAATTLALRIIEALAPPITAGGAIHRAGVGIGIALVPTDARHNGRSAAQGRCGFVPRQGRTTVSAAFFRAGDGCPRSRACLDGTRITRGNGCGSHSRAVSTKRQPANAQNHWL